MKVEHVSFKFVPEPITSEVFSPSFEKASNLPSQRCKPDKVFATIKPKDDIDPIRKIKRIPRAQTALTSKRRKLDQRCLSQPTLQISEKSPPS